MKTKNEILAKKIAYAIWDTVGYNEGSVTDAQIVIKQILDQEDALQALTDQAQELDMGYGKPRELEDLMSAREFDIKFWQKNNPMTTGLWHAHKAYARHVIESISDEEIKQMARDNGEKFGKKAELDAGYGAEWVIQQLLKRLTK